MTRTKICGLTGEADIGAAVDAGTDAVGFIVDVPVDTPRELSVDRAAELVAAVPPFVSTVLVTMPETTETAVDLAERVEPDTIQLHGDLPPEDADEVAARTPATVIKAVDADEPELCERYADTVDGLLVDSVDASGAGGTGNTHDWERTREVVEALDAPVILAGGLTPENVVEAVETVRPFGVDVASGVERDSVDPGSVSRKDPNAIEQFVHNAKRAREREVTP